MKITVLSTIIIQLRSICCFMGILILSQSQGISQEDMRWFDPNSISYNSEDIVPADCDLTYIGIDDELGVEVVDFESRPLFMHTQPQVKKWMKDKYLLECSANIYRADKTAFLLLHLKINSENAKHAYGDLEKGSKLKITFDDGEHIYVENIERDRGTAKRSKGITNYKGIYPLDGFDTKELSKKVISLIGVVWEEGYQEYEVQNFNLIKNQINCLKKL